MSTSVGPVALICSKQWLEAHWTLILQWDAVHTIWCKPACATTGVAAHLSCYHSCSCPSGSGQVQVGQSLFSIEESVFSIVVPHPITRACVGVQIAEQTLHALSCAALSDAVLFGQLPDALRVLSQCRQ